MTDDTADVPDGEHTAVVDRFEGELAVLEVTTPDGLRQLVVDEGELPEDGRHQDAVLEVTVESQELVDATYNERETESRAESAQDRFDQLSNRLGSDNSDDH
ncbi:DUF3006 domain-containing protein [Halobaculum magnesiiphilum]|uniref:DUF3006 domain-containing protein n=1 Tax=Halobaculum magnesiiphilum TaxID=1017351 RepID=A0A8T8WI29_9EURY|nr:DUF3006 domain-containing protein [Halobaculum magnesiiphilum]QZP39393.1 DUF3006 domain-containing protein [Halobaculum magnesiiphilum]